MSMTHQEALAAVAQGCINIAEGVTTIEHDSRIYRGMEQLVNDPAVAAAPRLLEALQSLAGCAGISALPGYKRELDAAMRTARDVIAEAEGATP